MGKIIYSLISLALLGCTSGQHHGIQHKNASQVPQEKQMDYHQEQSKPSQPVKEMSDVSTNPHPLQVNKTQKVILDVPIIEQKPELLFGCEVTSLAMVLQYAGVRVSKMELANRVPKDNDPIYRNKMGDIIRWGNPNDGFVGDMTGKTAGYAVYSGPMEKLMKQYLPNRVVNLTGKPFDALLNQIRRKKPVLVWTTGDYKQPDRWESWMHGKEVIRTPLDLHAVVLVGFEPGFVYLNDPLTGRRQVKVNKQTFIQSWIALGKQALSYK